MVTKLLWGYYYKSDSSMEIIQKFHAKNLDEACIYIAQRKNLPLSKVHEIFHVKAIYENNL